MKKLCVFDLDGTLTDTLDNLQYVTNCALKSIGVDGCDRELFKYFAGDGVKMLIRRAMEYKKCDMQNYDKCLNNYMEQFKTDYCYLVKPYEHIVELVTKLKENGVKLSVYSNKPHIMAINVVEQIFGKGTFDLIIGQREGYPVKPDATGVNEAIEKFNVSKEDVLYIGDTNTDVKTGKNADVYVVGVTWGFRTREELVDAGADTIVDDPLEILSLLDK